MGNYLKETDTDLPFTSIFNLSDNNKKIHKIFDLFNNIEEFLKQRSTEDQVWRLSKAFLYIQQNIFKDISLVDAADNAGITSQYLSGKFKEKFGINFIDFMTEHRINYARYLLITSNESIKQISASVGYSDPNYFSRVFKKVTGVSPKQCRSEVDISDC